MPAILTHDFFGKDLLISAAQRFSFESVDENEAFLLGNQGPDPLFYLVLKKDLKSEQLGSIMHSQRTEKLILALHEALSMFSGKEKRIATAYAAGFLAHYQLDRTVHPYVYSLQYGICDAGIEGLDRSAGNFVHAEIERDLDEMLLYKKMHVTVADYKPYQMVLRASDEVLQVLDKLYFYLFLWAYSKSIFQNVFSEAVKEFRLIQRIFYTKHRSKLKLLGSLEKFFSKHDFSLYKAMSHRLRESDQSDFDNRAHKPWKNPWTEEISTASFEDLYEAAKAEMDAVWEAFFDPYFDEEKAAALVLAKNFSGDVPKELGERHN